MTGGNSNDMDAHERIRQLHKKLKSDYTARWELDCFLLALYYDYENPPHWMILDVYDTFHYHNLPDITHIIRETLIGMCCNTWLQRLFNIFMCGKRYRRTVHATNNSCQLTAAIINTLNGLLLGLYPFNERRMDIRMRAFVAGSIHELLTSSNHVDFISKHQNLLCLSMAEYIMNVVHDFNPVEWNLLQISQSAKSQFLAIIESVRETAVVSAAGAGKNIWNVLESEARDILITICRFFKETSLYHHKPKNVLNASTIQHIPTALNSLMLQNTSLVYRQLKCIHSDISFDKAEALEDIWTSIYTRPLPAQVTLRQMEVLDKHRHVCSLVEHEIHHIPLCLACALTRKIDILKALFRYDTVNKKLVCNDCVDKNDCMVHVNMLGKVLYIRDRPIILCESCLRPRYWDTQCPTCTCCEVVQQYTCCVCNSGNVSSYKEIVNIERLCMQRVGFCHKHSLVCIQNPATIYDMKALELEMKHRKSKPAH